MHTLAYPNDLCNHTGERRRQIGQVSWFLGEFAEMANHSRYAMCRNGLTEAAMALSI